MTIEDSASDRRFLALPAVHPGEGVLPEALLRSLLALAGDVLSCCRTASFPTHRRSAREVAREVGVLHQFLEAVHDCDGAALLPSPAVLSLCDLHTTFQRLRRLLRDCSRRGARLWVLVQSDRVSCEFRVLIRSVATALDVLPLAAIDVPEEVKEMVRLVAAQSRRVPVRTDPADAKASDEVLSVLGQVAAAIAPDPSVLSTILNKHLQIRSWAECDEEILFLEEELGAALRSDGKGAAGEISLLSDLRGLMLYARSAVFEAFDGRRSNNRPADRAADGDLLDHLNLEEFRCPISLELMTDPVTVSTGHTYDRAAITRWLKSGNLTCPVTGENLLSTDLVPNSALRKLIRLFCLHHNVSTTGANHNLRQRAGKITQSESSAAVQAIKLLCRFLVGKLLANGSAAGRAKAVYEIRLLARVTTLDRACLVDAGAVPCLLDILCSPNLPAQDDAMAAILNLSKHPVGRKAILDCGGLSPIAGVLERGHKGEAQHNAAATIFYLSSDEEHRRRIGETPGAIPALLALLRGGSIRGKKNAAAALFGLLMFPGNHPRVLRAGAVPDLITLLSSDREDLVNDCLEVLAALAATPGGTHAILHSPAVPRAVGILSSASSSSVKDHCVSLLLQLCNNGGTRVVSLLDGVPSLMPALYQILAEGCSRAGKKASLLISILQGVSVIPDIAISQVQQDIPFFCGEN